MIWKGPCRYCNTVVDRNARYCPACGRIGPCEEDESGDQSYQNNARICQKLPATGRAEKDIPLYNKLVARNTKLQDRS